MVNILGRAVSEGLKRAEELAARMRSGSERLNRERLRRARARLAEQMRRDREREAQRSAQKDSYAGAIGYTVIPLMPDPGVDHVPVWIYLSDENIHEQAEASVEQWLSTAGVSVDLRDDPIIGSWLRYMRATTKSAAKTPAARDALLTGLHVADSHLVQTQDAYVTATLLQNVGPVLQALQPTKDAVVRAGALLIVKVDWVVQVHQLTAVQQAILDHQPKLAASPGEILASLGPQDPAIREAAIQPAPKCDDGGETTTTAAN
jgi:hypothetical protein